MDMGIGAPHPQGSVEPVALQSSASVKLTAKGYWRSPS
jgi:hypothetical protein